MSIQGARNYLKQARRELASAINGMPRTSVFFRGTKYNKLKRAIDDIDNTISKLRGL